MDWKAIKKHAVDILKASLAAGLITFLTSLLQAVAQIDFGNAVHAAQAGAGWVAIKVTQSRIG